MPSISPSTPVTVFHRALITCQTDTDPPVRGLPGGLGLLILDVVVLETPSGDEYCGTLEDGNVAGDKALPGVMVTRPRGSVGQSLPPVHQSWSKLALSLRDCFSVSPPSVAHDDL